MRLGLEKCINNLFLAHNFDCLGHGRGTMKKLCMLLCMLGVVQLAGAADVGFSNAVGGFWSYAPSINSGEGVFSFSQPITVDDVMDAGTDTLVGAYVVVPNLAVSNLTHVAGSVYKGLVTPETTTQIVFKDAADTVIMTGDLVSGGLVVTVGTTAMMYSDKFDFDITITSLNKSYGSAFINSLQVGWGFDFALTLQDSSLVNGIASVILQNETVSQGSTLSGDMVVIPEPASLAMLGLGSLLLWKRKR
jgi:hypothetical protein